METANILSEVGDEGQLNCSVCSKRFKPPQDFFCCSNIQNRLQQTVCPECKKKESFPPNFNSSKRSIGQWEISTLSADITILEKPKLNDELCTARVARDTPYTPSFGKAVSRKKKEPSPPNFNSSKRSIGQWEISTLSADITSHEKPKLNDELCTAQVARDTPYAPSFVKAVSCREIEKDGMLFTEKDGMLFTEGVILSDGNMLLKDYGCRRYVELDDTYKLIRDYPVDGFPAGITLLGDDIYMVVSKYDNYEIMKCKIDSGRMTVNGKFQAPNDSYGLAVCQDKLVVSSSNAVHTLSLTGSIESSINKLGGNSYVAVSNNQDGVLYYTDVNDVVCRSQEREIFRYRHDELKAPCGLCVDDRDFLYVCGYTSRNLHQISPNGRGVKIIELCSIKKPVSVLYNRYTQRIVITSGGENTALEIYKLH